MKSPSPKIAKIATIIVTPLAVLIAGLLVWQSSYAAFTGTTRNPGNNWATGSVSLTDDDAGSARFQATGMVPGDTETKCLAVTANASVPGIVKGYVVNPVISETGLQNRVKLSMEYGTGGGFGSCDGFTTGGTLFTNTSLAQLVAANSYENAIGSWNVAAGKQTRTYKITWTFDTAGMTQAQVDGLQGAQVGLDMQWELRND